MGVVLNAEVGCTTGLPRNVLLVMTFKIKAFHWVLLLLRDTDLVVVGQSTLLSGKLSFLNWAELIPEMQKHLESLLTSPFQRCIKRTFFLNMSPLTDIKTTVYGFYKSQDHLNSVFHTAVLTLGKPLIVSQCSRLLETLMAYQDLFCMSIILFPHC